MSDCIMQIYRVSSLHIHGAAKRNAREQMTVDVSC